MRNETIIVDNSIVANEMGILLSKEFVCYGYKKTAKQLIRSGSSTTTMDCTTLVTGFL